MPKLVRTIRFPHAPKRIRCLQVAATFIPERQKTIMTPPSSEEPKKRPSTEIEATKRDSEPPQRETAHQSPERSTRATEGHRRSHGAKLRCDIFPAKKGQRLRQNDGILIQIYRYTSSCKATPRTRRELTSNKMSHATHC
jgi:hypothetical protein